jgi:outer membrane protein, multidrug efflux system
MHRSLQKAFLTFDFVKTRQISYFLRNTPVGVGILALCIVSGCSIGPTYQRPLPIGTNSLPAKFEGDMAVQWTPTVPAADRTKGNWWEEFHDPILNRLESESALGNATLAVSRARLDQARAGLAMARSDFLPQVGANPAWVRNRSSSNLPENGHPAGRPYTFNNFTIPLQVGWEPDLWGRVRRLVEGSEARLVASGDDFESVRLAVQSELAADYFAWRSVEAEHRILLQSEASFSRALELVINRRKGGIATDLEVAQAETQLRSIQAQIPAVLLQRDRLKHAIVALIGLVEVPGWLDVTKIPPQTGTALIVPGGVPSDLLERRPDISAAERRMAAANSDIGIAKSAFYPRFRINGLAGLQSVNAGSLFDAPSRYWAVGPSIELPIFTGGRIRAGIDLARGRYTESVEYYREVVLNAFREVEDQLAAQQWLKAEEEAEASALIAARRALELAENRYRSGLVTFLEVSVAQGNALAHERAVERLKGDRQVAAVTLIKALGGGWGRVDEKP